MSAKIRRKKKDGPGGRPSLFFLIALLIGIILLGIAAVYVIRHPIQTPPRPHSAVTSVPA